MPRALAVRVGRQAPFSDPASGYVEVLGGRPGRAAVSGVRYSGGLAVLFRPCLGKRASVSVTKFLAG